MAKKYLVFNTAAKKLSQKFWPGPLTLVLDFNKYGKKVFKQSINKKSFDAGVRISSNTIATLLVKKLGKPLISTSANLSWLPAAKDIKTAIKYWQRRKLKPDIMVDAGKLPSSFGSTFVDARSGEVKILRPGDIRLS
ncbi:MAG: Sua5/YciO/YrdC/YwlC family protein [Patescibacteria group bacterium]